jgi:dTMP kinase
MTGSYVAFEGIEGAGKSTVSGRIADRLAASGTPVLRVREPGGTRTGEEIRRILLAPEGTLEAWTEALLFAAARAQLAAEVVAPALAGGAWVVSDRSVYSSLAYQGGGRRLGIDAVRAVNRPGLGEVWPDLVVLLRVDAATGMRRQDVEDRIGAEGAAFLAATAAAFDRLAAEDPQRFVVVDAARPLDEVVEDVWAAVGSTR